MTEQDAINKIKARCHSKDIEANHSMADDILCEFLDELGYNKLIEAWNEVEKWYA